MSWTDAPSGAQQWVPPSPGSIADLKAAAAGCHGCELQENATQTVFGRGAENARIVFVGEQPGDVEDQHGLPFVGPAGRLLREAVDDAGIDPAELYITNAVKHFRFETRGSRRIHQTPGPGHITACRPWLVAEFALLKPELVVILGATAAKALLGPSFRVTRSRGQLMPWPAAAEHPEDFPVAQIKAIATIHPSAVLRADNREIAYRGLVDDLKVAATA
jgi:uracil-DNA glycosylase family protein